MTEIKCCTDAFRDQLHKLSGQSNKTELKSPNFLVFGLTDSPDVVSYIGVR